MIPFQSALGNAGGREDAIKANMCIRQPIGCGKRTSGFKDRDSYREYLITGMCQSCQDNFYETCLRQEHAYCDAFNPCASPEHGSCPLESYREQILSEHPWPGSPLVTGVVPSDNEDRCVRVAGTAGQQEVHGEDISGEVHHAGEQQQGGSVA